MTPDDFIVLNRVQGHLNKGSRIRKLSLGD